MKTIKKVTILIAMIAIATVNIKAKIFPHNLQVYSYYSGGIQSEGTASQWFRAGIEKKYPNSNATLGFQVDMIEQKEITRAFIKKELSFINLKEAKDKIFLRVGKFRNSIGKNFLPPARIEAPVYPLMLKNYKMNSAGLDMKLKLKGGSVNFGYDIYEGKYQAVLKTKFFKSAHIGAFFQWGTKKQAGTVISFHTASNILSSKIGYPFSYKYGYPFLKNKIVVGKGVKLINQIETKKNLSLKRLTTGISIGIPKLKNSFLKLYRINTTGKENNLWIGLSLYL